MKKFVIYLIICPLISCNQNDTTTKTTAATIATKAQSEYRGTTIKATFSRGTNKVTGNFTQVYYDVETNSNTIILQDELACYDNNTHIECNATTDLSSLKPGIYRLMVKHKDGLLGCDLFEISPGVIPVLITIDNESTGMYIASVIMQKTGLTQKEIYNRVAIILGGKPEQSYDLEPTLYDLFMYYHGDKNTTKALSNLSKVIQEQQPLHINRDTGISNTMKPLF